MKALPIAMLEQDDFAEFLRWSAAGVMMCAAHVALVAAYVLLHPADPLAPGAPVVLVELAPLPTSPESSPMDVAPGPEMTEAQPPAEPETPKPLEEAKVEPPPPAPDVITNVIPPPAEKPIEHKKEPVKPQTEDRKKPPAPRTTAPVRVQTRAQAAASPRLGISSAEANAAQASWRDLLIAHLQRNKRYPSAAQSRHDQGTVVLSFSMDRNGRVLARHIARSSGVSELDEEVLSMIQRAQPLPAFPPSMTQARMDLTVPIKFSLR